MEWGHSTCWIQPSSTVWDLWIQNIRRDIARPEAFPLMIDNEKELKEDHWTSMGQFS